MELVGRWEEALYIGGRDGRVPSVGIFDDLPHHVGRNAGDEDLALVRLVHPVGEEGPEVGATCWQNSPEKYMITSQVSGSHLCFSITDPLSTITAAKEGQWCGALSLNKLLNKQSSYQWFEVPWRAYEGCSSLNSLGESNIYPYTYMP